MARRRCGTVAPQPWTVADDDALYEVGALEGTPLAILPKSTVYALISSGKLPAVRIGARIYLRKLGIRQFLADRERSPL